jgi:hypothetical protein
VGGDLSVLCFALGSRPRSFWFAVVVRARDEFSTYDWIMEGIITRSGFRIDTAEYGEGFQTAYVCTKR